MTLAAGAQSRAPTFAELFTPKLVTILREGYGLADLRADAVAGLTVAIVALPLSMAIAIASGLNPAQGLYAAIVGGFLVSALDRGAFGPLLAGIARALWKEGKAPSGRVLRPVGSDDEALDAADAG